MSTAALIVDLHGRADGAAAVRGEATPAPPLPCQYNDNCIEKGEYKRPSYASLSPNRKKIRHKMIMAIEWMVRKHGIERVGVLTLSADLLCHGLNDVRI